MTLSGNELQSAARGTAKLLADATHGRPFTPQLDVWKVRGKVFLIVTEDDPDLQIITLKVDPQHGDALCRDYPSITPGHYLNKKHWISVGPGTGVTERLVEHLVQDSYDLAGGREEKKSK